MGTNLKTLEKGIEGNTETATKFQAQYGRRADPIRHVHQQDIYCKKSNPNFRDIIWNVEENLILHEIFRVVSRFPLCTFHVILRKVDYLWDCVLFLPKTCQDVSPFLVEKHLSCALFYRKNNYFQYCIVLFWFRPWQINWNNTFSVKITK